MVLKGRIKRKTEITSEGSIVNWDIISGKLYKEKLYNINISQNFDLLADANPV